MEVANEFLFLVQGSAEEPYSVRFIAQSPSKLLAYCSCPAGMNGMYCKHRVNILMGSDKGVVSDNKHLVLDVAKLLPGTEIETSMREVEAHEEAVEVAKRALTAAKKALAGAMLR
jgi:hypothetical protein